MEMLLIYILPIGIILGIIVSFLPYDVRVVLLFLIVILAISTCIALLNTRGHEVVSHSLNRNELIIILIFEVLLFIVIGIGLLVRKKNNKAAYEKLK